MKTSKLLAAHLLGAALVCAPPTALLAAPPTAKLPAKPTPTAADPPTAYTVKSGDNLYTLGDKYLVDGAAFRAVQKANKIKNPRRLPVGSTLTIPAALLKSEPVTAKLVAFRGEVSITGPGGAMSPQQGMTIAEGYGLATAPNAFLTIQLPDLSRITLPSKSRLKVTKLRRIVMTGGVQRGFAVEDGRSESTVTPAKNPDDRFIISTPLSVSAVRGTEFRAKYDPERGRSTLEVLEGVVAGSTPGSATELLVSAGSGASTAADGISPAQPLLPSPSVVKATLRQDEPTLGFQLQPAAGAQQYRAQIAADAGFIDLMAETDAATPQLAFPSIANGTYFVRFTAIDAGGLEGLPATYAFERRLNSLALGEPKPMDGAKRRFLFKWQSEGEGQATYRFVLSRETVEGPAVLDQSGLSQEQVVVTDLPGGVYYWRVLVSRLEDGRLQRKWSPAQRFEVGP